MDKDENHKKDNKIIKWTIICIKFINIGKIHIVIDLQGFFGTFLASVRNGLPFLSDNILRTC